MLKRLKIKFVIVIMTIVTILFGAIFGLVMHLTKQNIERESIQMMRTHALRPQQSVPFRKPDDIPDNIRLPFLRSIFRKTVRLDHLAEIIMICRMKKCWLNL